jgi:hypothetical protein
MSTHEEKEAVMSRRIRWVAAAVAVGMVASISVTGCSKAAGEGEIGADPATVESVDGPGDLHSIKLSQDAAERIGLKTDKVVPGGAGQLTIDIAAVLYDQDGATWVYGQTELLTFQRMPVVVSRVDGNRAVLESGPPVGTAVATLGAAELRGSEDGVPGE